MNPDASLPDSHNEPPPVPAETPSAAWTRDGEFADPFNWRQWVHRLLVCNPFFLLSAALLLFGLNRLSVDPGFLQREEAKLLFNVAALLGYESLVVATALVLARRRVWYDSALLVVVEAGLLLAPFLFISQAALIDRRLAVVLATAAALGAAIRLGAVRRWYPRFRLPGRLLGFGAVVLAANLALVFGSRHVMETTFELWQMPNEWAWSLGLPILVLAVLLLPKPAGPMEAAPEKPWLPLFIAGLWVAGTGVHLWCVAWICKLPLQPHQLAPGLWAAAWVGFLRLDDVGRAPSRAWRLAVLSVAGLAPLLTLGQGGWTPVLLLANTMAFWAVGRADRSLAQAMNWGAVLAGAGAVGSLPTTWIAGWTGWNLGADVPWLFAGGVLVLGLALRHAHPVLGLLAAVVGAGAVQRLAPGWSAHGVGQLGATLLLLHSLRWTDAAYPGAKGLRLGVIGLWGLDAWIWCHGLPMEGVVVTLSASALVLAAWGWARFAGYAPTVLVPAACLWIGMAAPGQWLRQNGSPGMVALLGSFGLFALGAVIAWKRPENPPQEAASPPKA